MFKAHFKVLFAVIAILVVMLAFYAASNNLVQAIKP